MAADSAPPAVRPSVEPVPVRPRPRRLWVGIAAAVLVVAAGGGAAWVRRSRPPAQSVVTLTARDGTLPPDDLRKAAGVLLHRLTAAGYPRAKVSVTGDALVVTVGGTADIDGLRLLAQPGRLSLRAVVAAPTVPPRPWTMLSTPPGRPASRQISASMNAVTGVSSDGFATAVFPVARAGAIFHVRR